MLLVQRNLSGLGLVRVVEEAGSIGEMVVMYGRDEACYRVGRERAQNSGSVRVNAGYLCFNYRRRLAREEIAPSPRVLSAVSDSVQLARMILRNVVGS